MAQPAWSGTPPTDEAGARERLIDATRECMATFGARKTGLADIARVAGVSRQTLYRYYPGGRSGLLTAVLIDAAEKFNANMIAALEGGTDPLEMAADSVILCVAELRKDPVLKTIGSVEDQDGQLLLGFHSPVGMQFVRSALQPIRDLSPWMTDHEYDSLCELMLRLAVSLLVSPSTPVRSEDELRESVRSWLGASTWLRPPSA